ncbi:hypothetical protein [Pseudosulfitobacter sp. SM2401]|uniref:FitA-like ribbon-helix-helix domain-containing protein n=1 Tax=Pseudosulfitobacter sp. SM2401 TaxID=3350098 RepID=UPI0036F2E6E4
MKDLLIDDISDEVLSALYDQAEAKGISLEEHARRILCDALGVSPLDGNPFVSVEFLRDNHEAVLDAANKQPVCVFDAGGKEFVIVCQSEFDRLGEYFLKAE